MTKLKIIIPIAVIALTLFLIPKKFKYEDHLYLGRCALWNNQFEIIQKFPGSYCYIVPNTGIAAKHDDSVIFTDKNGDQVFKLDGIYHHDISYSEDTKTLYAINANDYQKDINSPYSVVSGITGFTSTGEITFELKASNVIDYFKSINIELVPHGRDDTEEWLKQSGLKSRDFLIWANNIHVVPNDIKETAFKKNDIILNIIRPSGFLLIDHQTAEIKKWFPYFKNDKEGEDTHRPIIIGDNLYVFFNKYFLENNDFVSKIASYNLKTEQRNWIWPKGNEPKIKSPTHGGITKIDDKHLIVYSLHDKFILELNLDNFEYRYVLAPDSKKLELLRDGQFLVSIKIIPYKAVEDFYFLKSKH